ncbi:MAG: DNA polymerase IV [Armatimonadota bacterium]|jgi:DNA polymerase-4
MPRTIIHVDMDAFFAAVEQRDNPELRGKPVVVGGSPEGRGVVSAASYEAREFGIRSAMPMATAVRLCPHLIRVSVGMANYSAVSREVMDILRRYTPLLEKLSIDEAFLDVTGCEGLFGEAPRLARGIKREIRQEVQLTASLGVAPSKFLAKVASDLEKPDGLVVVEEGDVEDFLRDLPISHLWGVGKVTEASLNRMGIRTIGDLAQRPREELERRFGEHGTHLHNLAHGRDNRKVVTSGEAKSVSSETTFAQDTSNAEFLAGVLLRLSEDVGRRLRKSGLQGRTVQLKVRFADFKTITRRRTLEEPTDSDAAIYAAARSLLRRAGIRRRLVRLVGVGVSNFSGGWQPTLFDEPRRPTVDKALDELRQRYGRDTIRRARLVDDEN